MIDDGHCDMACSNAECNYDGSDCGCAPGCYTSNYGNCDMACLVPECAYDNYTCAGDDNHVPWDNMVMALGWQVTARKFTAFDFNQDCQSHEANCDESTLYDAFSYENCDDHCPSCAHSFGTCFGGNYGSGDWYPACNWGWGSGLGQCLVCYSEYMQLYTFCIDRCPRSMPPHPITTRLCYPANDTSTSADPDVMYVTSTGLGNNLGSWDDPYLSLSMAMTQVIMNYTTIYLLDGEHQLLPVDNTVVEGLLTANVHAPLQNNNNILSLFITTLFCTGDALTDHPQCASSRAVIHIVDTLLVINVNYTVTFENVVFDGNNSLVSGCILPGCYYCPLLITNEAGQIFTDRGDVANVANVAQQFVCNINKESTLFYVKASGKLVLNSVEIKNIRYQPKSVIFNAGGSISLNQVNFSNIIVNIDTGAVIYQSTCAASYGCGSLSYDTGIVEYINNGYEYVTGLQVNGFLFATGFTNIEFTSVTFQKNIVINENPGSAQGLIVLQNFLTFTLINCTFHANIVTVLISVNAPKLTFIKTADASNNIIEYTLEHIHFKDSTFTYNLASTSLVSTVYTKYLQNIKVESSVFTDNICMTAAQFSFAYTGTLTTDITTGQTKPQLLANGSKIEGYMAPRHVIVTSSSFTRVLGLSIFSISNLANIQFSSNVLFSESGASTTLDYNSLIVSIFINDPNVYLKNTHTEEVPSIQPCTSLLSFQGCYAVSLNSVTFNKNYCEDGPAGISAVKVTTAFQLSSVLFTENKSDSIQGTVLQVSDIMMPLTFSGLQFSNNVNTNYAGSGLLSFGVGMSITIDTCTFTGNQIPLGGALYALDLTQLTITKSVFTNNSATAGIGGALYIQVGSEGTQSSMSVSFCTFTANTSVQGVGGAIMITSDSVSRTFDLQITSTTFTSNSADSSGSALYIDTNLSLAPTSTLQYCTFSENSSLLGTVSLFFDSGQLTISNSIFTSNKASSGAGVASATQTGATVVITASTFTSNTSAQGVIALTDTSLIKTLITSACTLQGNTGIILFIQSGVWTDSSSTFTGASAGAVSMTAGSIASLQGTQFNSNTAQLKGGAVYLSSQSILTCSKCTFLKNSSGDKGGALFVEQSSQIQISGSTFDSNTCIDKGSAIFILSSISPISTIASSTFINNAAQNSGTIYLIESTLNMTSVTLNGNKAVGATPGIVLNLASLNVTLSTFLNQIGSSAVFLYATTESTILITSSTFASATGQSGGAFNLAGSIFTLIDSQLSAITALSGAGLIAYSKSVVTLKNVVMFSMSAQDSSLASISEGTLIMTGCSFSYFGIGGIVADKLDQVMITDTMFSQGTGTLGGGFTCTRCGSIYVSHSTFSGNIATWGGGTYLTAASDSLIVATYQIEYVLYENNSAWRGAGAYSNDVNVLYNNCTFLYNNASIPADPALATTGDWGRGGGVMTDCKDVTTCVFGFEKCEFDSNSAQASGGGIAWQDVRPNLTNCTFSGNSAPYGSDISSFAIAIKEMASGRILDTALSGVASGQTATQSLVVSLVDHYGNVVTSDNSSTAELQSVDQQTTTISGVTKVTALNGIFTFNQFIISAEPGTTAKVQVYTSAVDTTKATKAKDSVSYTPSISITAEMRLCQLGESHVGNTCQVCQTGQYSLDPNNTSCTNCPTTAICYGNYTMVPRAGYWRPRIDSDKFYSCLLPSACTGSPVPPQEISLTGNCQIGYKGNLCESCVKGYSRNNKYECAPCPNESTNIVRLVFIAIAVAILAGIMVYTTLTSAHKQKSLSSIYIKILMNYLQIVILASSFNLQWPDQVKQLFEAQNNAGSFTEQVFSVDCFLQPAGTDSADMVVYNKLVVMAVIPVLIAVVSVLVWIFIYGYKWYSEFPVDGMIATIVILLFLAHPTITKYMFNIFSCMAVDGQYYLLQQMDVKCWDSQHVFYIVACTIPAIVLWVLGIPTICLFYLVKNKRRLGELAIRIRLGFLFNGYRKQAYYWEFVILYRKILIICCSVFLTTISIPIQALCVMFIVILALYLQDKIKPFITKDLNELEFKSIICAAVTIYCGLFFLTDDTGTETNFVLFLVIVLANFYFLWHWSMKMFGFYIILIINRVPFLRRYFGSIRHVDDGLEEDLFVRPHCVSPFQAQNEVRDFTPTMKDETAGLQTMRDMYLMKMKYANAASDGELEYEFNSEMQTSTVQSPREVPNTSFAHLVEVDTTEEAKENRSSRLATHMSY